jgi:Kef-type K+ transport system membrane component KefB
MPLTLDIFSEFALLMVFAAVVSAAARLLKQPLIVAYIAAGLIAGPLGFNFLKSDAELQLFAEMGVAFLLFTVGLNLNPKVIQEHGKAAFLTGLGQVLITAGVGYGLSRLLGFASVASFYLGIGLCFSSTIIILKLISDKGDLDTLYAKLAMGFLLVQDLVAILLIFAIPVLSTEGGIGAAVQMLILGLAVAGAVLALSWWLLPKINNYLARSQEFLLLFAIAWGVGAAALFRSFGFSLESGALLGGVSLAVLASRREIASRLSPIRDFFLVLFFILLGAKIGFADMSGLWGAAGAFILLVVVGNPLILMAVTGILGFTKRTSFLTAMTAGQVSEFSLILMALGVKLGQIGAGESSLLTLVAIVTILISTYLFQNSEKLYWRIAPALSIFEKKSVHEKRISAPPAAFILFGANRIGFDFIRTFRRLKLPFLVVDHDPDVVSALQKEGMHAEYGDADDAEFLRTLHLSSAQRVVSTVPDIFTNLLITDVVKSENPRATVMAVAHTIEEAHKLYEAGADYAIMPHFLGGQHAAQILERGHNDPAFFSRLKQEHKAYLSAREMLGHEHPSARQYDPGGRRK